MGGFTTVSEDKWRSNNVPAVTDPVLTQPGLGITTTTITTITQTGGDWSTGLFNVCGDKTTCNMKTRLKAAHTHSHLNYSTDGSTKWFFYVRTNKSTIHSQLSLSCERKKIKWDGIFVCRKYTLHTHTHSRLTRACAYCRYSRGCGAVLFGPEFISPVWRVSVHASATRIHFCHTSWDQGAVQDTGECLYSHAEKTY